MHDVMQKEAGGQVYSRKKVKEKAAMKGAEKKGSLRGAKMKKDVKKMEKMEDRRG